MLRLIVFIVFLIGFLAIRFLPWWASLGIGIALILSGKFFAGRIILWLFMLPFKAKGRVLRAAEVEVHFVRPIPAPVRDASMGTRHMTHESPAVLEGDGIDDLDPDSLDEEDDLEEEPDVPRDYYEIEVTITPQPSSGPFHYWDYSEVSLVKPGKKWDEDDNTCRVDSVQLADVTVLHQRRKQTFEPYTKDNARNDEDLLEEVDEFDDDSAGTKVVGSHRLRMRIGAKPEVRELAFNYYFENFGSLELP